MVYIFCPLEIDITVIEICPGVLKWWNQTNFKGCIRMWLSLLFCQFSFFFLASTCKIS